MCGAELIDFFTAIGAFGALYYSYLAHRVSCMQRVFELNELWRGTHFSQYRLVAWEGVYRDWVKGDRSVSDWIAGKYFDLDSSEIENKISQSKRQAIREIIGFFCDLGVFVHKRVIDKELTVQLFGDYWSWWGPFITEISEELTNTIKSMERNRTISKMAVPRIADLKYSVKLFGSC